MSIWKCYYFLPRILSQKYGKQHGSRSLHLETIHRIIQAAGDLKFLVQTTLQRVSSEIRAGCKSCIQLSDDCSYLCATSFIAWQEKCFSSLITSQSLPYSIYAHCLLSSHHALLWRLCFLNHLHRELLLYPLKSFSPGWTLALVPQLLIPGQVFQPHDSLGGFSELVSVCQYLSFIEGAQNWIVLYIKSN